MPELMMAHLDIGVTNLDSTVAAAIELYEHQPQADVRVLADPAGHPFCLYLDLD